MSAAEHRSTAGAAVSGATTPPTTSDLSTSEAIGGAVGGEAGGRGGDEDGESTTVNRNQEQNQNQNENTNTSPAAANPNPTATTEPSNSRAGLRKSYLNPKKPLGLYEIPFHSDFGSERNRHPDLGPFISAVFEEAKQWGKGIGRESEGWKKIGKEKVFGEGSAAKGVGVEKFEHPGEGKGEVWFGRGSWHVEGSRTEGAGEEATGGNVTWEDLDRVLRKDHSKNESQYTPNVYDWTELVSWNASELQTLGKDCGMKDVGLWMGNMYHGIPFPLNDRVFSVLVLVGVRDDLQSSQQSQQSGAETQSAGTENDTETKNDEGKTTNESIIVQLPIDLIALPDIIKNRSHHRVPGTPTYHRDPALATPTQTAKIGKKLVYGEYVSVERVSRHVKGERGDEEQEQEARSRWVMATVSDAKGVLPGFLQRKAVPGEIVKDVEYVYGFLGKGGK